MAKAVKTISRAAKIKADGALLQGQFAADEAKLINALEGIDGSTDEIARIMQLYASDLIRLASIRLQVCAYGMYRWATKKNALALIAAPTAAAPYAKCDRAYCLTLAGWDNATQGKFPAEYGKLREAGYEKWRYVCSVGGIDPKALNPQGVAQTTQTKGKRRGARKSASAANAKGAAAQTAAQTAAQGAANAKADQIRVNATIVESVNTLAALKSAYQTDEARLIKLQAANAKLYTGDVFKAHEELIAAFKKFYAAAN